MAITAQQSNFISTLISLADTNVENGKEIDELLGRWFGAGINSLSGVTNGDIQTLFPHLTTTKVTSAITALAALQTALGSGYSGTNRGNLEEVHP